MKRHVVSIAIIFSLFYFFTPTLTGATEPTDANGWTKSACQGANGRWYEYSGGRVICIVNKFNLNFNIPFAGLSDQKIDIATYISAVYKFGVGVCAVLAVMMIMIGGVIWLTAGGSQERVTAAKTYILGAITGLVLALGSYTMLKIVNPSLVMFSPLKIPLVVSESMSDYCPKAGGPTALYKITESESNGKPKTVEQSPASSTECGFDYLVGSPDIGASKKACRGWSNCTGSQWCLPKIEKDPKVNNSFLLKYSCNEPETACTSFYDDTTGNVDGATGGVDGFASDQSSCSLINDAMASISGLDGRKTWGQCLWIDYQTKDDGCAFCSDTTYSDQQTAMSGKKCEDIKILEGTARTQQAACRLKLCRNKTECYVMKFGVPGLGDFCFSRKTPPPGDNGDSGDDGDLPMF